MNITPKIFFTAWVSAVHEMRPILAMNWRNSPKFTGLVKSADDCVLQRVASKVGLKCYPHDYYSVDAVLYQECDLVPGVPAGSTWLRALSVAFEHENDIKSDLYKEVSHLLILNADLRVLVAYPTDGIEDREWVHAHSIIHGARHQKEISDRETFLLILGSEINFGWDGYLYKENGWEKI